MGSKFSGVWAVCVNYVHFFSGGRTISLSLLELGLVVGGALYDVEVAFSTTLFCLFCFFEFGVVAFVGETVRGVVVFVVAASIDVAAVPVLGFSPLRLFFLCFFLLVLPVDTSPVELLFGVDCCVVVTMLLLSIIFLAFCLTVTVVFVSLMRGASTIISGSSSIET